MSNKYAIFLLIKGEPSAKFSTVAGFEEKLDYQILGQAKLL